MPYNFRPVNRDQIYLLPPSIKDWLPPDHLAWFVLDAVEQMDLGPIYKRYRADGWGPAAYEPSMMVSLLLYGYCVGERSSRRIERLCQQDVAFRAVAANQAPDHVTIARFRQQHEKELAQLFTGVLKLCTAAGLVKLGVVALDGTKIKASAALDANRTYSSIGKEVERMLSEAKNRDAEEDRLYGPDRRGDELPEDLRDPKSRYQRLQECKRQLDEEANQVATVQEAKLEARAAKEAATGKKVRGRRPKEPSATPEEEAKANVTDPDSRIMKTRSGYVQGYNAQAVVTKEQIIVAADVTQEKNDYRQLHPMLKKAQADTAAAGMEEKIGKALADAGYCSEDNLNKADPEGPELYVATIKDHKSRKAMREQPYPRGRIPKDLNQRQRMERKLLTKEGRATYKLRGQTVEPVFGQIKVERRFDRFLRRGLSACVNEWRLACAAHNLVKLWRATLRMQRA